MKKRKEYLDRHKHAIYSVGDKWETELPEKNENGNRKFIRRKTKKDLEDAIVNYYKDLEVNPTLESIFKDWVKDRLDLGKIVKATYDRYTLQFNRYCYQFGKKKVRDLTSFEIQDFLERTIHEFNLTAKEFSNIKGILLGVLKYAKRKGYTSISVQETFDDLDISTKVFKKVIKEDSDEVFDETETELMIDYLKNNFDIQNLGILIMFVTGIRVGELATLKHEDFDGDTVKIRRTETRYLDKDNKVVYDVKEFPKSEAGVRTVVFPSSFHWLVEKIKITNPFSDFIFVKNDKRMTTECFRDRLIRVCDKVGIKRRSPHKIRKTYVSMLLDNHVDNKFVQQQVGHTNIGTSESYYHRNRRSIDAKQRVLDSVPDLMDKTP